MGRAVQTVIWILVIVFPVILITMKSLGNEVVEEIEIEKPEISLSAEKTTLQGDLYSVLYKLEKRVRFTPPSTEGVVEIEIDY